MSKPLDEYFIATYSLDPTRRRRKKTVSGVSFVTYSINLNQVHVENCSFSPHPQPFSQRARGAGKAFKVPLPGERA